MTVDPHFIGTQAQLARSIRYIELAQTIAPHIFSPPHPTSPTTSPTTNTIQITKQQHSTPRMPPLPLRLLTPLLHFSARAFFSAFRALPARFRMRTYDLLRKLGDLLYGVPDPTYYVRRLPFGLYLKYRSEADLARNEFHALARIRRETSIPAPVPLDLIADEEEDNAYLLMTRLPGHPLGRCEELFSDEDCEGIVGELRECVAQLRALPRAGTENPHMVICNTLGGACREHRIREAAPVGPFADEAAFSRLLRFGEDPARRGHRVVFTHADLSARNVLVERVVGRGDGEGGWRVSGIVDWETAGYYPEYWDYTKALFGVGRWRRRYVGMVHRVFAAFGDYSRELEVERRSWELGDGV